MTLSKSLLVDEYNIFADHILGLALALVSLTGTFLNISSFIYFHRQGTARRNSRFFKTLYLVITLNDTLICLSLVPVIQAVFSPNRGQSVYGEKSNSLMFYNKMFCNVWVVSWWMLSQLSIVMVAFLSLSRLFTLTFPLNKIKLWLSWAIPTGFVLAFIAFWAVLEVATNTTAFYAQEVVACFLFTLPISDIMAVVTNSDLLIGVLSVAAYNIGPTLIFLTTCTSCALSVVSLRKTSRRVRGLGNTGKRLQEASKSTIIFTVIYILCNIPLLIFVWLYLADVYREMVNLKEGTVLIQFLIHWNNNARPLTAGNSFLKHYMSVLMHEFSVALNSTINPIFYYYRMKEFRDMIRGKST